ncbi:TolC family protein [Haliscomenobacter hydrossis]|uniref:Outer membrane efflux protein n=1 Tax=Haliscomenobacter hydrossis (strain ATCC 27775 / DSM 1100 / LMG 10767 / O) TaxID=760192 RepID=F4KVC0_HALH1|nr:TolC family protein [Haliscomenobacter hydrossis]AEE50246.1 outer membrane efflux protein [Haliscomenobacter hydrossis DSM 1100]
MRPFITRLLFLIFWLMAYRSSVAQAPARALRLDAAVEMARGQSIWAKQAATQKETAYWRWRSFTSDFKPQLSLSGTLPSFTRSFVEVTQPDGNIAFLPVSFNNSSLNLALSQRITRTGGTVFAQKQLQRFDNFIQNSTLYNGIPMAIGISQPLSQFNLWKWDKQTEPLQYNESQQQYLESLEQVALDATVYYFNLLIAQVNLNIAETNLVSSDTLYKIATQKLALGKISQNDLLQLQLGVLNAQKDLASARQGAEVAQLQLKTHLSYRGEEKLDLAIPLPGPAFPVDAAKARQEALSNRADAIAFKRRLLEASRDLERAKSNNGFNATLTAAFGLSNRGNQPLDIYQKPQDREFIQLEFSIPIMDWGRSKSRTATAKANLQLAQQTVEQDKMSFEQEVYTQVTLMGMLQQQVNLTARADEIAAQRFQIAQDRFLLSDLSITDLSIAIQEKDRAKRDYILALRDYWRAYYTLRLLTLYDFEQNRKIQ